MNSCVRAGGLGVRNRWPVLAAIVSVALAALLVSGCTVRTSDVTTAPVSVGASADPSLVMAAYLYRAALAATGTAVSDSVMIADDGRQLAAMAQARRDLVPVFSGGLLRTLVPTVSALDSSAFDADYDPTYVALNKALPQGLSLADPTTVDTESLAAARRPASADSAVAPAANGPDVPSQQLVPVYRTAAFSRAQVKTVNKVAGELTAGDLSAMVADVARGSDAAQLASAWVVAHGLNH